MDADAILRNYKKAYKTAKGIKTFKDAQLYAEDVGERATDALGEYDYSEVSEGELSMVLRMLMRQAFHDSGRAATIAQRMQNEQIGLGIGVLEAEFDPATADKTAAELVGKSVTKEFVRTLLQQSTVGAVDETIRKNAEARDNMGLTVHIVRKYSDVGLRNGTQYAEPCQWCLSRCGDWDNYKEAYNAGCFERHPGCCCEIDYHVGKTHTRARGLGAWVNV